MGGGGLERANTMQKVSLKLLKKEVKLRLYKMIVSLTLEKYESHMCQYHTFKLTKLYT